MAGTMRAYRLLEAGAPPRVVEVPIPVPAAGQIVLRVAGAGLCHSDLLVMHANPAICTLPLTLGHEATGWAHAIGPGVKGVILGQAYGVYFPWGCGHCARCHDGNENICDHSNITPFFGFGRDGGLAEYVLVDDARHLVPLGDLDAAKAAPLMCAGITSYHAISPSLALLTPGSTAAVIGVGGLGHLAIQMLKALSPAQVIAIDRQPDKLAQALALGADHALASDARTVAQARDLTGGCGVQLVLDLVGNDATLSLGAAILAQGGALKIVGVGGGTLPVRFQDMPRDTTVTVPFAGTLDDLRATIGLAQNGAIHCETVIIGFNDLTDTYALLDSERLRGRAILVPG